MNITWTEYPDDISRRENKNGRPRSGQVWCDGPSPGTRWCIPFDEDTALYVLVHTRQAVKGFPNNYSVTGEKA